MNKNWCWSSLGYLFGPISFLIFINDLSSNVKQFAEDTSLFFVSNDINESATETKQWLKRKLNDRPFQRTTSFNPDRNKQAQEIILSGKLKKIIYPPMVFNISNICKDNSQKHEVVTLSYKLIFSERLGNVLNKVNKTIGLHQPQSILPRKALFTIWKAFVGLHLDYSIVLYDQIFNNSFHGRLEQVQHNACLAITRPIRGRSEKKK